MRGGKGGSMEVRWDEGRNERRKDGREVERDSRVVEKEEERDSRVEEKEGKGLE